MERHLVALWLSATIIVAGTTAQIQLEETSELKQKALEHTLEKFYSSKEVINGFALVSIQEATETEFSAGTFVRLQLKLKQTNCNKNNRARADCKVLRNGREMSCYSCFKFASADEMVVSPFVDCLPAHQLRKEREGMRAKSCKYIEDKDESGLGFPGVFSFSKSYA
ncbi:retinoic acid receptor responder protein 2-like [Ambystoma mexicanum]|uniref:retinoic acid receptor responder protein 2-like n=1 Tax=Ambystoma mexicanum TaxID=8296 RepID=UPI0037E92400